MAKCELSSIHLKPIYFEKEFFKALETMDNAGFERFGNPLCKRKV